MAYSMMLCPRCHQGHPPNAMCPGVYPQVPQYPQAPYVPFGYPYNQVTQLQQPLAAGPYTSIAQAPPPPALIETQVVQYCNIDTRTNTVQSIPSPPSISRLESPAESSQEERISALQKELENLRKKGNDHMRAEIESLKCAIDLISKNGELKKQNADLAKKNAQLTKHVTEITMNLQLAQDSICRRDKMDTLFPPSDPTDATEKASWCFRCHCPGHWMGPCCNHSPRKHFDCYSFQLDDIVCDNDTFESINSKSITKIEELVFHIFHATRRLSYYDNFTIDRDNLLAEVIKKSASDVHVGTEANSLARLRDVRPYEVYAAKACRLTHDLMEALMLAIQKLYVKCVLPNVGFDETSRGDPTDVQSFEKLCYKAMLCMKKSCIDARAHLNKGTPYTPLKRLSIGKDLKSYRRSVESAYQHYASCLQEIVNEWSILNSKYKLWKIKPTARQGQVFADLPFINLIVDVETHVEMSIPAVRFPTVASLQHYYKLKGVVGETTAI